MATLFPTIAVSQASSRSSARDMVAVKYGNGYEQRLPNGINYKRDMWSVSWDGLNTTDKNTIVSFINTVSDGSTIQWTSPFDTTEKKYVLEGDWSISDTNGAIYSIQITLRQVYDLT